MSDTPKNVCMVCGTPFVPSKKTITLDGTLKLDGTHSMDAKSVCPKCHPELVKED